MFDIVGSGLPTQFQKNDGSVHSNIITTTSIDEGGTIYLLKLKRVTALNFLTSITDVKTSD
jgi:hypothetical protein